jgi:hypothetical protein
MRSWVLCSRAAASAQHAQGSLSTLMGQSLSNSVDRLERHISTALDSSVTPSTVQLNQRLDKCFVSYNRLLQDVRLANLNYSKQFVHPHKKTTIRFQIHSKIPLSQLPNKWKYSNNCIVTANETPNTNNSTEKNSSSSPSFILSLREFYYVFLYLADNNANLLTATAKLYSVKNPEENKTTEIKRGDDDEPSDSECSICLANEVEVALPCLHTFCKGCLTDWQKNSAEEEGFSCPICRVSMQNKEAEDDSYDMISANSEKDLKDQIETITLFLFKYIEKKPTFQPKATAKAAAAAAADEDSKPSNSSNANTPQLQRQSIERADINKP